jgi:formamidopyrimidine-DNA glycosylase
MPELPEVETVKNDLLPYVTGQTITGITLNWNGIVKQPSPEEFKKRLIGRKIIGLSRRAKFLLFKLDSEDTLIAHLRMTGSLLVDPPEELNNYIRAVIHLDGNRQVYFRDPRKFARMMVVQNINSIIGKLGPEPLEESFTPQILATLLAKRKAPLKAVLLDQELIAGLGNMYADEALFEAGINPMRAANSLTKPEIKRLFSAIREVLKLGIMNKGASEVTYYRPSGEMGKAFEAFKVAHQRDKVCPKCGKPIQWIKLRGRGTYFCAKCQPEKK